MTRVLVVDDDDQLLRTLRISLSARQYEVAVSAGGTEALRQVACWQPDLVVLDLGLPDMDGVDVIRSMRCCSRVPILVLSGRSGTRDKIQALDAGADDFVTKPFDMDEFLAHLRSVARRIPTHDVAAIVPLGRHSVDLSNKVIHSLPGTGSAEQVHLSRTEWRILETLLRNPGKLISQEQLLAEIWGPSETHKTHYLRQYVSQLRKKLEPTPGAPRHLLTENGQGYRFQP